MAEREPTYDCFALHSLISAPGWHAVLVDQEGRHFLIPVHVLALANRRTYSCKDRRLLPSYRCIPEDECREVVGLDYTPDCGFNVCDDAGNYCGLLPPDWTLEDFTRALGCGHLPPKED